MNTFDYFKQICQIPRESGNEEGMRKFILSWAKENGFKACCDKAGSVVVYAPATKGYEKVSPLALQGHMDMVCVKTAESKHDFRKDPIEVVKDGDWLKAKDTSLGGDNGIAVAMTMALFTDKKVKHGPLEGIFTYSEETGMDGAFNLDPALVNSRKLINLDSEEEGIIYIGCAGGIDLTASYKPKFAKVTSDWTPVEIKISGLLGGHSGGEIHLQRLNAISAMARLLVAGSKSKVPFMLSDFDGGVRRNVIPNSCYCKICLPEEQKHKFMTLVKAEFEDIKNEYKFQDPDLTWEKHCAHCNPAITRPSKAVCPEDSVQIAKALNAVPHGVYAKSFAVKDVVETSDNLAIAKLEGNKFNLEVSVRSLIDSAKVSFVEKIKDSLEAFGFKGRIGGSYPSWAPNPKSELAKFCAKAWKDQTGKKPLVTSIHAGLECGIINSRIEGMDSVSMGPNLFDVHSVNEKLSISSTERLYEFLKHLLSIIR